MDHGRSWIMDSDFVCKMVDRIVRIQTYMFAALFLWAAHEQDGAGRYAADCLPSYLSRRREEKPGAVDENREAAELFWSFYERVYSHGMNLSSLLFDAVNLRRLFIAADDAAALPPV